MVLEVAGTQNLEDYLGQNTPSPDEILLIAKMLFEGLVQMEGRYVHRDIKPANLMVTIGKRKVVDLKYIDFGLTVGQGARGGNAGTPFFMPPELWPDGPDQTVASYTHDVYGVGETLYNILCGQTFHGMIWDEFLYMENWDKKKKLTTVQPGSKCSRPRSSSYSGNQALAALFNVVVNQMLAALPKNRPSGTVLLDQMHEYWQTAPMKPLAEAKPAAFEVAVPTEEPFLSKCHKNKGFWFSNLVRCCGEEKPDPLRDAVCEKPCGGKVAFVPGTKCVDRSSEVECGDPRSKKFSTALFCCVALVQPDKCDYVGLRENNKRNFNLPKGV